MKGGLRSWLWRSLIEWLQPPLEMRKYAVMRREYLPEVERKLVRQIARRLKQNRYGFDQKHQKSECDYSI